MVYALIALGYTMVYGIIELINFAHGEVFMVGSFAGLLVLPALGGLGLPWPALLVAGIGVGIAAFKAATLAIRRVIGCCIEPAAR